MSRRTPNKTTRWPACNILQADATSRHLFQFSTNSQPPQLKSDLPLAPGQPLPDDARPRSWRSLFLKRLNIAWLPASRVFLRIVSLPTSDPAELPAMLELQLDKISPLPSNQVVWSFHVLPTKSATDQSVLVIIAERTAVEQHLGLLEQHGYQADLLELPLLHSALAHKPPADGACLHFAPEGDRMLCLAAWWTQDTLRQVNLIQLPNSDHGPQLLSQLLGQFTWAAQFEGWLPDQLHWHIIAPSDLSHAWETAIRSRAGDACSITPAASPRETALHSAQQHSRHHPTTNILPPEFASRYRQQTIDRLWMQGLAALLALYLVGLAAYFATAQYHAYRDDQTATQIATLAPAYTNALNLRERVRVLQEQSGLKFAALDCWRLVSELLPAEVTLDNLNFQGGERLFLSGSVPIASQAQVNVFNAQLRKLRLNNQLLFEDNGVDVPRYSAHRENQTLQRWDFTGKLRTTWIE